MKGSAFLQEMIPQQPLLQELGPLQQPLSPLQHLPVNLEKWSWKELIGGFTG